MRIRMLQVGGVLWLAACGGGAALGGGADMMRYAVPDGGPLTYDRTDSLSMTIEAPGMGFFTTRVDQDMRLGLTFTPSADGLRVTTSVERLAARMTNPMGAPATLSEADLEGELVFAVDGRGNANLIDLPEVSGAAGPIFNATSLAYDLLPKLPPPGLMPGSSWADTTAYAGTDATGSIEVTWAGTSTLAGDTVVDGRRLRLVRTHADVSIAIDASVAGRALTQNMSGPETGFYLFDPSRGVLVSQELDRDLEGTVKVAVVPLPMKLTAKQRKTMTIVGG